MNSFFLNIKVLCSNSFLEDLSLSFENSFKNYFNVIKNYINNFNNVRRLSNKNKYNIKTIENIKNYINNNLFSDLSNEFKYIINGLKENLIIIINCKLNNKYEGIDDYLLLMRI